MKKIIVFLGPSLSKEEALRILPIADYRPPAGRGDVLKAIEDGAKVIGLIDGVFYHRVTVTPREIMNAIDRGVIVIGGASIGALRACELDNYGMIGIGKIYNWYKEGKINADDEVAVAYHPSTYQPISEALVNIRATLDHLLSKSKISEEEAKVILRIAKEVPFYLRNYNRIIQRSISELGIKRAKEIFEIIKLERIDQKREDAIEVLKKIKEIEVF
ncbi:MAG: TfuA-related McrA-glycine thioamidation protein [Candidatus Methanomethylicota archaeon]|jgi:hypothetical protein|uniref:TfuA-related McrA-glycine thioamidation protein n=1 Tax=Thermoproteota archaeon TaxID=2056631 RepID=A0A520KH25_9CREN|nr:MAG: TfuA-related McrA-glycine thioamidation protein [Candidatus Verstraetearchaeota archaeon]TDA37976.1 MAG: TfuA-related McrA-glycine thioamidation protein [Candidatus Verstraetearchaeota archaeon]